MQEVNKLKACKLKEEQKIEAIEKDINDAKKDVPMLQQKVNLNLHNFIIS